jgi:hypothetical protein
MMRARAWFLLLIRWRRNHHDQHRAVPVLLSPRRVAQHHRSSNLITTDFAGALCPRLLPECVLAVVVACSVVVIFWSFGLYGWMRSGVDWLAHPVVVGGTQAGGPHAC